MKASNAVTRPGERRGFNLIAGPSKQALSTLGLRRRS
jgi:hypothetical protein